MSKEIPTRTILEELEPVAEKLLNNHLRVAKPWNPHEYVPWSRGRDFAHLGGEDWSPEQSNLSDAAQAAMRVNLLTEDNLPWYHNEILGTLGRDGALGTWVGRWTAEEARHGVALRDYLVVTRGVDPVELEQARMVHMQAGFESTNKQGLPKTVPEALAYVTFQELATRISHRNTGKAAGDPIADKLLARIAMDENLHMVFYRDMTKAALEISPNETMRAVADEVRHFKMPGANMPGFGENAIAIANAGIYDLDIHGREVVEPILGQWDIEHLALTGDGDKARGELLEKTLPFIRSAASRFIEQRNESADLNEQRNSLKT